MKSELDAAWAATATKRFFFNLQGTQNINDPLGLLYASDLEAFRVLAGAGRDVDG